MDFVRLLVTAAGGARHRAPIHSLYHLSLVCQLSSFPDGNLLA